MARQTQLTSLKQISEINLTPLMDLTFILLITFIITFPLIEQGIPVNLPSGKSESLSPVRATTVTLHRDGRLFLDEVELSRGEFDVRMMELGRDAPDTTIMVRADERVEYGSVVKILKMLHKAHLKKTALVTKGDE